MKDKPSKLVTIGGGSGQYALLSGLRDLDRADVTAIVSMMDSGGSTGRLRDELGVLPPGDILKCVLALSKKRDVARDILQKRFSESDKLRGHSVGNMLLTILSQYTNDFPESVRALGEILDSVGDVLPVTTDKASLVAELSDGTRLFGEAAIDVPRGLQRAKIVNTFLAPHNSETIRVYPPVIDAIKSADYVIIGPGDLYTSIIPNFLVGGVVEAIRETKAKIVYVLNIMTKFGETDNFTGEDFIRNLEKAIGRKVNIIISNSAIPEEEVLRGYEKQKASLVSFGGVADLEGRTIIEDDLLNRGDIARHNPEKLAQTIINIIN